MTCSLSERRTIAQQVVQGKKTKIKVKHLQKLPPDLTDMFYLLGDYAFKNTNDLGKAIDYYALDVTFNPERYRGIYFYILYFIYMFIGFWVVGENTF